jgi:acetyl-CoA carboxylase biotin carboxylase subunit
LRKDANRGRPFRRVLIANRGEIALRILRACRELGIEVVAIYSDADSDGAWVEAADHAVRVGPAPASESYLRGDAIVEAALATRADAIHPGYGFLSERADFARKVVASGIAFVGPPPDAIAALGDKLAARRAAADAGVPVVPGSLEEVDTSRPDQIQTITGAAERIGFPLLVKAAAGGGGRGMRRVERSVDLPAALAAGAAEAASAFGDGRVYLEREIRQARHIEVQLLGDVDGEIAAIGERDCSIQRRHQKLIEEAPAPGLTDDQRRTLHEFGIRAARAAGLENAATAEFLWDADMQPWFLEVNARLQVEHGVTELVTGLDIVREQLFLAAGRPLSDAVIQVAARAARPDAHAIEVRLSAEDPGRDFAPAPGRVRRWSMPEGPGVRVDTAMRPKSRVPPDYDPLIAKILVVDRDRDAAIDRMRRALDEVDVSGVQTTLPFHRSVMAAPEFRRGEVSIAWVADRWDGALERGKVIPEAAKAAAVAAQQNDQSDRQGGRTWTADPAGEPSLHKDSGRRIGATPSTTSTDRLATPSLAVSPWRRSGRQDSLDRWPR